MKTIFKSFVIFLIGGMTACQDIVEGINDNPNNLTSEDVSLNPELFLTGAMLANTQAQLGHLNRISGMWSGQLTGFTSLYGNIYGYNISTAESVGTWSRIYIGVITNTNQIQSASTDPLLLGISKVLEAHAIGTAASIFGDVPYSEANNSEIDDPSFDDQMSVFSTAIELLNSATTDLGTQLDRSVPSSIEDADIHFGGDPLKWLETANTLKARYYLQMKDYASAYTAATQGISSNDNSMRFIPRGSANVAEGDKNLFWTILEGSRGGDIGTGNSYMMQLLSDTSTVYRGNAKTNEFARFGYFQINEESGGNNSGVIEQFEPQPMVTFQENMLILAEAGTRAQSFDVGLGHLNEVRQFLSSGDFLNENFVDSALQYDDYLAADFAAGGMENTDAIDATRALLREVIEERFISGFGTYMAFNDARRLRKADEDVSVPFPLNPSSATQHPERLPYSDDELNSNSNGPNEDPGIYSVTRVNL